MKYTNNQNLPSPLRDAIIAIQSRYDAGDSDFTVTGLLKPPRIKAFQDKHRDELVEDVSDNIYSSIGTSIHHMLEMAGDGGVTEERYYHTLDGYKISAQVDWVGSGIVCDWKVMSVWEVMNGGLKPEKAQQLNVQAYLAEKNGVEVESLWVCSIYRDWSKSKARFGDGYPPHQVQMHPIERWSDGDVESLLRERIALHVAAKDNLPECTVEERWAVPDKTAVMKKGRKRAVKLFEDEDEAQGWVTRQDDQNEMYLEPRPGEAKRCAMYCPVSDFCTQRKEMLSA